MTFPLCDDLLCDRQPWLFICLFLANLKERRNPRWWDVPDWFVFYKKRITCRCSLFFVSFFVWHEKKLWCILCDLLLVCHRSRSNVSYRLICNVLRQSAYPFRYTVEKKMQFQLFSNASHLSRCLVYSVCSSAGKHVVQNALSARRETKRTVHVDDRRRDYLSCFRQNLKPHIGGEQK